VDEKRRPPADIIDRLLTEADQSWSQIAIARVVPRERPDLLLPRHRRPRGNSCSTDHSSAGEPSAERKKNKVLCTMRRLGPSLSTAAAPHTIAASLPIPVGNLDNAGALGELFYQRVRRRPIGRVKIGIPLVQEIDRGVGMLDDLFQRP
jgi:hypothetical protein